MRKTGILHRLIFGFVSSLFLLTYVNQALFTHTHILPNGVVVVHAHPYHKEGQEEREIPVHHHTHTPAAYHALSLHLILISALVFLLLQVNRSVSGTLFLLQHVSLQKDNNACTIARAPPLGNR